MWCFILIDIDCLNWDFMIFYIIDFLIDYGSINLVTNIFMGLSYSNDEAPANAVKNATAAMKVASSPNYTSKYAYYKDIR